MLEIGNKLYYIDFEKTHSSYIIKEITHHEGEILMPDGDYYVVIMDKFPNCIYTYEIPIEQVDSDNIYDKFYSTPEKAKIAYKEYNKQFETDKKYYKNFF